MTDETKPAAPARYSRRERIMGGLTGSGMAVIGLALLYGTVRGTVDGVAIWHAEQRTGAGVLGTTLLACSLVLHDVALDGRIFGLIDKITSRAVQQQPPDSGDGETGNE